jgi:hypothetical protein
VIAVEHSWGLGRELIAAEPKNIKRGLTLGLVQQTGARHFFSGIIAIPAWGFGRDSVTRLLQLEFRNPNTVTKT